MSTGNEHLFSRSRESGLIDWLCGRARTFQHDDDWRELVRDASSQGLAGLVLEASRTTDQALPDLALRPLKINAARVAGRTNAMMNELGRVLAVLNEKKIPVMLLKGAALSLQVYGRTDLRPMGDLDLLVMPCDATDTLASLEANDLQRGAELIRPDFFPRFYYETELYSERAPGVRVDLHAQPFRPLRYSQMIQGDALWADAMTVRHLNATAKVPAPSTMLIHLAAHAAFHGCNRLIWLYDIARFCRVRGIEIDFDRMIRDASSWQLQLAVHKGLSAAQDLFGAFGACEAIAALGRSPSGWRDRQTLRQAPDDATRPWRHVLTEWLCTPGWSYPTSYALSFVIPSDAHLAAIYPHRHLGWRLVAHAAPVVYAW